MVDTGWVELSVVCKRGPVVVSVRDTGGGLSFVVAGGPMDIVNVSGPSGSLEAVV